MPISFQCPNAACKQRLTVKDEAAGKKGICPACKTALTVPMPVAAASATSESKSPSTSPKPVAPPKPRVAAPLSSGELPAPPKPRVQPASSGEIPATPKPRSSAPSANGDSAAPRKPHAPAPRSSSEITAAPKKLPDAPSPNGHAPVDADAEAAAFFSDEPTKVAAPTSVKFKCEWCDQPLEMSLDEIGKRMPCPECRRIIKVPDIAAPVKKDWLKLSHPEPPPEGAAGSAQAPMVSEESLKAAGADVDDDDPRVRMRRRLKRLAIVCFVLGAAWGTWAGVRWWLGRTERTALATVQKYVSSSAARAEVDREGLAALHHALGDYHFATRGDECAQRAIEQYRVALEYLSEIRGSSSERDAVLIDIALSLIELVGSDADAEKKMRLKWTDIHSTLGTTLGSIRDEEARMFALRAATRRLIAHKRADRVLGLASQAFANGKDIPKAEAMAAVALQLWAAGQKKIVEANIDAGARLLKAPTQAQVGDGQPVLPPSVAALGLVVHKATEGYELKGFGVFAGQAEGVAYANGWVRIDEHFANIPGDERVLIMRTALGIADAGPEGAPYLDKALNDGVVPQGYKSWLLMRVIDAGVRAGAGPDRLYAVARQIKKEELNLRARGQLLAFRAKLAQTKGPVDEKELESIEAKTLSAHLARLALARHNTALDSGYAKSVFKWEDPGKAFGAAGVLLGLHAKKK